MHVARLNGVDITVDQYMKLPNKPIVQCPACDSVVSLRAGSARTKSHFVHGRGVICYLIARHRAGFLNLNPGYGNPSADILEKHYRDNWREYYCFIRNSVTGFNMKEFVRIHNEAVRLRVWNYIEVNEDDLKFILLTLISFDPRNYFGVKRLGVIKFIIMENNVGGNLWIDANAGRLGVRMLEFHGKNYLRTTIINTINVPLPNNVNIHQDVIDHIRNNTNLN